MWSSENLGLKEWFRNCVLTIHGRAARQGYQWRNIFRQIRIRDSASAENIPAEEPDLTCGALRSARSNAQRASLL